MSDKSDWPKWLQNADTKNARVDIAPSGKVIWRDGVWCDGVWRNGVWCGGVWRGGVWRDGVWHNGVWCDGVWRNGVWYDGVWHNGVWCDGVWRNGVWRGGVWRGGVWRGGVWRDGVWCDGVWRDGRTSSTRCMYPVIGDGKHIWVGCERRTAEEWERVINGEDKPPEGAPTRNSEAWRLLVAAFRAQVAYQKALEDT